MAARNMRKWGSRHMRKNRNGTKQRAVQEALKYAVISSPLLYVGFFMDAGAKSYSADLTGRFFNAVLENQTAQAQSLMGAMLLTLIASVVILPVIVLLTNIVYFRFSLGYEVDVVSAFFKKTYENAGKFDSGSVAQKLLRDSGKLQSLLVTIPSKLLAQLCALGFMACLMARISGILCVVCMSLGAFGAACPVLMRKKLGQFDEAKKRFQDQTAGIELEMIGNRSFLKSYGLEKFAPRRQENVWQEYEESTLKKGVWMDALAAVCPEGTLMLGKITFLVIGMGMAAKGHMAAGNLVAFFSYLTLAASLFGQIHQEIRQLAELPGAVDRVAVLMEGEEFMAASPQKAGPNVAGAAVDAVETWSRISASGLVYRYEKEGPALTYDDFYIEKDNLVEIFGENGSGKTTLLWILSGLLKPVCGKLALEVDAAEGKTEISLGDLNMKSWRADISFVEQIPAIFPGTLRENILLGDPAAPAERVDAVLRRLGLTEQAQREVNTVQQLSGGELKKISLGRALLRDSNILILDEPFEHLDAEGKRVVEEMLSDENKTRIFIRHGEEPGTFAKGCGSVECQQRCGTQSDRN